MVFTIKLIGFSCKFSHHPILWEMDDLRVPPSYFFRKSPYGYYWSVPKKSILFRMNFHWTVVLMFTSVHQGHRTCMGMNQTWLLHPKNVGIMWQDLPLKSMNMTIYLVVDLPIWKMMEFVSGDDYSQLNGTIKIYINHVPNHQPDILLFQWLTIINHRLTID